MQEQTIASLEELPEFQFNPFDGGTDVPVFEIVRLTYIETPHTNPPYNRQEIVSVVGRSPDANTIYFARKSMLRKDGSVMAIHSNVGDATRELIERYEVLVPNSKLAELKPIRQL